MQQVDIPCIYDDRDKGFGIKISNICPTQRANRGGIKVIENQNDNEDINSASDEEGYRIRKLTPKECWRLMDFDDEDFEKAQAAGVSNTQLYKQAGNSIVVAVLYNIYKELYQAMPYLFEDLKVGSYFSGIGAFEKALDRLYEDINAGAPLSTVNSDKQNKDIIIYDDYNSNIRTDQSTIGTLTSNIGNSTLRNAYKIIEGKK